MADVIKDEVVEEVIEEVVEDNKDEVVKEKLGEKTERLIEEMKQQLEELKAKNAEPSPEDVAREEKMKELWNKEVNLELRMAGLEDFAEFINVEEHNSQ